MKRNLWSKKRMTRASGIFMTDWMPMWGYFIVLLGLFREVGWSQFLQIGAVQARS